LGLNSLWRSEEWAETDSVTPTETVTEADPSDRYGFGCGY